MMQSHSHRLLVCRLAMGAVCACALLASCTTNEVASQPSAPLGTFEMTNNVLDANISVDTSRKLVGEAEESILFGFIPLTSPMRCATGVSYNPDASGKLFSSSDLSDREARVRAAAAYNAVIGKADILVAPQWSVVQESNLFVTKYTARVSGYAGTIRSITHNDLSHLPVSARQAYKDMQARPGTRRPDRDAAPAPASAPAVPNQSVPVSVAPAVVPPIAYAPPVPPAAEPASGSTDVTVAPNASPTLEPPVADLPSAGAVTERTTGPVAVAGDSVRYHYTCALQDGPVLFDSRDKGAPRVRTAGASDTPSGLGEALVGMHAGESRRITLPPSKAFGSAGVPNLGIPPNATVVFDIYVDQVVKP